MPADYDHIREENIREYGEGTKHLAFLGRLYSDRTHFIFELIQNAEDVGATYVSFSLYPDRLEVRHDGQPFTDANVVGICGVDASTKAADLNKIGKFGIGFKSVYAYTHRPQIHSGVEHFRIEHFVRPYLATAANQPPEQTLFIFPFDHEAVSAAQAQREIAAALDALDLRTVLFLRSVARIDMSGLDLGDASLQRTTTASDATYEHARLERTGERQERGDWLIWSRNVEPENSMREQQPPLLVQIAFSVKADLAAVIPLTQSPLVVFFPTEKETHLGFLIQGPYRTTPARDNVPLNDPCNAQLIRETAALLPSALADLVSRGLADVQMLEALPIHPIRFQPGSMFRPIYESAMTAFQTQPLIPTNTRGHVRAADARLARGTGMRELFSAEQLVALFDQERLQWGVDAITSDLAPSLWTYLRHELHVDEITPARIVQALDDSFLSAQTDAWIIKLYHFLLSNQALWRAGWSGNVARTRPIIRLENGDQIAPFDKSGRPLAYLPTSDRTGFPTVAPTVATSIVADEQAASFLTQLGLTPPDIAAEVIDRVLPSYAKVKPAELDWSAHERDLRLIQSALSQASSQSLARLRQALSRTKFLLADDATGKPVGLVKPGEVYTRSEPLLLYFDGNPEVRILDDRYSSWTALLPDLDIADSPRRLIRQPQSSGYVRVADQHGWHVRGVRRFDPDGDVDGLKFALENPTSAKSAYVWNEILVPLFGAVKGIVETSTRAEFVNPRRNNKVSPLGRHATSLKWIPTEQGTWVCPDQTSLDALPEEFGRDESLARALGMTLPTIEILARKLGITPEQLRSFADPEERKDFFAWREVRRLAKETERDVEDGDGSDTDDGGVALDFAEAWSLAFDRPDLPNSSTTSQPPGGGTVANPELRRERTATSIAHERSVEPSPTDRFAAIPRKVWENKESTTRRFLIEQYDGRCQMCGAGFLKRDGKPYFEGLYLIRRTKARWIDRPGNILCLCPTCCARLQYAPVRANNLVDQIQGWRTALEGGGNTHPELAVTVGGTEERLIYTEKHLLDLQEMLRAATAAE